MYKAKIITVTTLEKHPNADRIQILRYGGMAFIVGLDVNVGDLMCVFLSDGQLSHEFCHHNNLYRDATKNKDTTVSGFFEDTRRVRVQPFRGVKSEGFACGLSAFSWCGNTKALVDGYEFDELNGKLICEKYVTEATRKAITRSHKEGKKKRTETNIFLNKHYDTENIKFALDIIPQRSLVIITEKLHGTSGRTGYVKIEEEKYPWYAFINSIFGRKIVKPRIKSYYGFVSGTRNTIINDRDDVVNPESSEYFRWIAHNMIIPLLLKGETIYYEIVGFDSFKNPIMKQQSTSKVSDKNFRERFGNLITYSYGCEIDQGPFAKVFVYRITVQNDNGFEYELPWFEVERRCKDKGLLTVPVLDTYFIEEGEDSKEKIQQSLKFFLNDGASTIDHTHLMEGIVVRIENNTSMRAYKAKNYMFQYLEGILKDDPSFVDAEEIS